MSYDLHFFRPQPGRDPLVYAQESLEEDDTGAPAPEAQERKKALAAALMSVNPSLEPFVFDHAEIAKLQGCTPDEARQRWRHIELNGPEDGNGIQIMLFDQTASITVPYWHRDSQAQEVLAEVWEYARVLHDTGGFLAYDPQQECVLSPDAGPANILTKYADGMAFTDQVAQSAVGHKKPWWKIW